MADVTISQLTRAFPSGNSIVPFTSGGTTYGSAMSSLFADSDSFKTIESVSSFVLGRPKLLVAKDTTNGTNGSGPSNSTVLASLYANTIEPNNNITPRGLEIGAPAGNVTGPVYLKVSATSNRFAIFDQNNNENFTIKDRKVGINTSSPVGTFQFNETDQTSGIINKTFFISFTTAPSTKYLRITHNSSGAFNLQATMIGVYNYINAGGSYRKNYAIHYNTTTTELYGYGSSVAFNIGNTSTFYAIDEAYKPNNTTILIPIRRYSPAQGTNPNQLGLSLQLEVCYGINYITAIEVID